MRFLLLLVFVVIVQFSISAQSRTSVFNQKWSIQFSQSSSLVYKDLPSDMKSLANDYYLINKKLGNRYLSLYNGFDFGVDRLFHKRNTIGFEYGIQTYINEVDGQLLGTAVYIPMKNQTYKINLKLHTAYAPVKNHFIFTLGYAKVKFHEDNRATVIADEKFYKRIYSSMLIGLGAGGNEFLTRKLYLHYRFECNLLLVTQGLRTARNFQAPYYDEWSEEVELGTFGFYEVEHLVLGNLFNFNFGLGINL